MARLLTAIHFEQR